MTFADGPSGLQNGYLIFSVLAALSYAMMLDMPPSWRRTVAKTLSVLLLGLVAFLSGGPGLLVAALLLSAAGDAFLAQKGERAFLAGLASFLAAHIAYIVLFAGLGDGITGISSDWWRMALVPVLLIAVAITVLRLWPALPGEMRIPVAAYVVAILMMGLAALTMPSVVIITGAVAFMASDTILAFETFVLAPESPHRRWTGRTLWALYYAAQILITIGLLL